MDLKDSGPAEPYRRNSVLAGPLSMAVVMNVGEEG